MTITSRHKNLPHSPPLATLRLHVDQTIHVVPDVVTEPVPAVLVALTHLAPGLAGHHLLTGDDPLHGPVVRLVLSQAGALVRLVVVGRHTAAQQPRHQV